MITLRKSDDRGRTSLKWLDSAHTFSFNHYHDPDWMGFRSLRVINDDVIAPGGGFGEHPHSNMEILTWVTSGALAHKDSMGNGSTIAPGWMQRMTAGSGLTHSEFNASSDTPATLLQIWIRPAAVNLPPSWEERDFSTPTDRPGLTLLATGRADSAAQPDDAPAPLRIHQDVDVFHGHLPAGAVHTHALRPGRGAWIQMIEGEVEINGGPRLGQGDGASVSDEDVLTIQAAQSSRFLLFDLA